MRDFLYKVKQIYFWVLCPIVVLLAAVFWYLGVSNLAETQKKNRQAIDGLYSSVSSVAAESPHPNSKVAEGMQALILKRKEEVAKAWTEKYSQQTSEENGILAWPKELKSELIDKVKPLHPIETHVDHPVPPDKDLILSLRRNYQEHIQKELPKLAEAIGARWQLADSLDPLQQMGGYPRPPREGDVYGMGGSSESAMEQSLVEWSQTSQMEILQQHFLWEDRPEGSGMPSPGRQEIVSFGTGQPREPNLLEILYAQEDLWILQAMMNIIAKTNEGATARFNAAIKEIVFIRMGKPAVRSNGRISRMADFERAASPTMGYQRGEGAVAPEGGGEMPEEGYPPQGEGGEPVEGEPAVPTAPDPAENRYVDRDYKPLSAQELRQVMREPASVEPERAYLAVAKRIPVRMRVKIDQSKLESFLVQCANSPLTIEVRQVRINPQDDGSLDPMALDGGMVGQYPGVPPGGPPMPGVVPGSMQPGVPGDISTAIDQQSRTVVTAEVYGIVYLFNPVDKVLLKLEPPTEEGGAEEEPLAAAS